jgi:hypothetical protein
MNANVYSVSCKQQRIRKISNIIALTLRRRYIHGGAAPETCWRGWWHDLELLAAVKKGILQASSHGGSF